MIPYRLLLQRANRSDAVRCQTLVSGYRAFVAKTWGPLLTPLGFDPRQGKHAADEPERQQLRAQLVSLLAEEARDPAIRSRLADAAGARLKGDASAPTTRFCTTDWPHTWQRAMKRRWARCSSVL